MSFIAGLDYGQDSEKHLDSLRRVIHDQGGSLHEEQYWFPYEVIELGASSLTPGHEREFAICTLLLIKAVAEGFDTAADLQSKFSNHARDYDLLPTALRDEILGAYEAVDAGR